MSDPAWMGGGIKKKEKTKKPDASPLPKLPMEPINFRVRAISGDMLDCLFYPSTSYLNRMAAGPKFCYVFGHGGADHQRAKWVKELAARIVGHGYSVATIDFRGNGESTGRTVG
jgi:pimeloyl-ACP methyl ester carboxylesterase